MPSRAPTFPPPRQPHSRSAREAPCGPSARARGTRSRRERSRGSAGANRHLVSERRSRRRRPQLRHEHANLLEAIRSRRERPSRDAGEADQRGADHGLPHDAGARGLGEHGCPRGEHGAVLGGLDDPIGDLSNGEALARAALDDERREDERPRPVGLRPQLDDDDGNSARDRRRGRAPRLSAVGSPATTRTSTSARGDGSVAADDHGAGIRSRAELLRELLGEHAADDDRADRRRMRPRSSSVEPTLRASPTSARKPAALTSGPRSAELAAGVDALEHADEHEVRDHRRAADRHERKRDAGHGRDAHRHADVDEDLEEERRRRGLLRRRRRRDRRRTVTTRSPRHTTSR